MSSKSITGTTWLSDHQSLVATVVGVFLTATLSASGWAMMVLHNVDNDSRATQASVLNIEKSMTDMHGMLDKLMPRDLAESTHADIYRHLGGIEADIAQLEKTCVRH